MNSKQKESSYFRKRAGRWYWKGQATFTHRASPGPPLSDEPINRLTLTQPLKDAMAEWSAVVEFNLVDGVIREPVIRLERTKPGEWDDMPSQQAFHHLRISNVRDELRAIVEFLALPDWFEALNRVEDRPGRRSRPDAYYLKWVERRIEAEQHQNPIQWMVDTFPDAKSVAAVNALLHRAKGKELIEMARGKPPRLGPKAKQMIRERKQKEKARGICQ